MSTEIKVKHYGTTLRVYVDPFPSCCGAKIIRSFRVDEERNLNLEKKNKMYEALMNKILPHVSGLLVTADCVLNFGEWAELKRSGGGGNDRSAQTEEAGDVSLENFCEYFNMQRGPVARNNNSGNLVASFSMPRFIAKDDGSYEEYNIAYPDFSDDDYKDPEAADVSSIIAAIQSVLEGGS